jgi:hypothetical protein
VASALFKSAVLDGVTGRETVNVVNKPHAQVIPLPVRRIRSLGVGTGTPGRNSATGIRLAVTAFRRRSPLDSGFSISKDHLGRGELQLLRSGSFPIEKPNSVHGREPRVASTEQAEPGNRPLAAKKIGIEHLYHEGLARLDRVNELGANGIVRVPQPPCHMPMSPAGTYRSLD